MTCDDAVLELSGSDRSEALLAHLAGCLRCREVAQVLDLATLPSPSPAEQAAFKGLAATTRAAWDARERQARGRRRWMQQGVSLAAAAGLGALVASGAWMLRARPTPLAPEAVLAAAALASADDPESYLQDDEVFFDVSWPEGDTP
jgi:hypothetical protein